MLLCQRMRETIVSAEVVNQVAVRQPAGSGAVIEIILFANVSEQMFNYISISV